ncbi:MAG: nucleoside monophosphate kinase [Candidatus Paceibacterota bacterium]
MNQKKVNIVIMGSQGSGKGTQAQMLIKEYNLQHLETGAILRKLAKEDTKLGKMIDIIINKNGEFVPWSIVREILDRTIDGFDKERGIIFDGTPRRIEEVHYWEEKFEEIHSKFDFIFFIKLSEEESLRRISSRRICKEHGHSLIFGKDVQREDDKCPICGSAIYQREDDTPEKVIKRLAWSREILGPVIEYYKEKGLLTEIDGSGEVEDVFQLIKNCINQKI